MARLLTKMVYLAVRMNIDTSMLVLLRMVTYVWSLNIHLYTFIYVYLYRIYYTIFVS